MCLEIATRRSPVGVVFKMLEHRQKFLDVLLEFSYYGFKILIFLNDFPNCLPVTHSRQGVANYLTTFSLCYLSFKERAESEITDQRAIISSFITPEIRYYPTLIAMSDSR